MNGWPVPPLVGVGEAAEIIGVSKQRIHQLVKTGFFPAPVARLAATPVWRESDIHWFAANRQRIDALARVVQMVAHHSRDVDLDHAFRQAFRKAYPKAPDEQIEGLLAEARAYGEALPEEPVDIPVGDVIYEVRTAPIRGGSDA